MTTHHEPGQFTPHQVGQVGIDEIRRQLIVQAMAGPLINLLDGRDWATKYTLPNPVTLQPSGNISVTVTVDYWLADPLQAAIGDCVHPRVLRPDAVQNIQGLVISTYAGRRFESSLDGWLRTI